MGDFFDGWTRRIIFAWSAAWIVYMIAVILTVYDGGGSLLFQPICGAICASIAVIASFLLTPILWVRPIGRIWNSTWIFAAVLIVASALLLCFGSHLGLGLEYIDPETGENLIGLHPAVGIGSYCAMVFAVANWPEKALLHL
jgi:hypothetical protein